MLFLLLFAGVQVIESYRTNLLRRNYEIEVKRSSFSHQKVKNIADSWYFVHFDQTPDFSLLSTHGIDITPSNMISKQWYSLFLTSAQAQYLSKFSSLRAISSTEKIIDEHLIKYSQYLEIETSSTFNPSQDLKNFDNNKPIVYKLDSELYQIKSLDNQKLATFLSNDEKVYSISPKNDTLFFNNRAAGFTQFNTNKVRISGENNDTIVIDRYLESKGLTGEGQVILVADTYLDPNSTFFYDPKIPLFERNHYYSDHRKLVVIQEDTEYTRQHTNEHGTHVAGCSAGSTHVQSNLTVFDGVARQSKIAFYQSGDTGVYNSDTVKKIVEETKSCVCTNSWGYRNSDISSDNQWNKNAKVMNDTLFMFASGNFGSKNNKEFDYYGTLTSPGAGKNLLTVGALSSIPIEEQEDKYKKIYFFEIVSQQTYMPSVKVWSLSKGNGTIDNPGVKYLFEQGSFQILMTRDVTEDFQAKRRILIVDGKSEFLAIPKDNPPFMVLTTTDFEVDDFESLGFSHLFPVLYLDNDTVTTIYKAYDGVIELESNYVDSNLTDLHRASYSSKGPANIGLMKPEIVAPGTSYISARSDPDGGFGHADIAIMDGTSMATPNVAGATSLVSQYFVDKKYRSSKSIKPSSSLMRSILINSADPLDEDKVYPNAEVGFGSLNLGKYILTSVSEAGNDENVLVGDHIEVIGDQHLMTTVEIKDNSRDFRVTLSYLDEVLNGESSSALIVMFDLVVISPDESVYRGNQRPDDTEESYSTNQRVIVKKNELKPGKYEIHVFSSIPEIVPNRRSEFSISIFGSLSDSTKEMISFEKAQKCIPVVEKHGKCNQETTLNECTFSDLKSYTGHSCQIEVLIYVDSGRNVFEIEPFGVKYVSFYYPLDAVFSDVQISMDAATNMYPKYAYIYNTTGMKHPLREIGADKVSKSNGFSVSIDNVGQVVEWEPQVCLHVMVYNKSPKRIAIITKFGINDKPKPSDPTPTPKPDVPTATSKPDVPTATSKPDVPTATPKPDVPTATPKPDVPTATPKPDVPTEAPSNDDNKESKAYFISFILVCACCLILFIIIVILAILIFKVPKTVDRSEVITETIKSPLL